MSAIKHLVSKKKKRFQDDGFDLDLSYITPQIIAMGFPSEGIEGQYRNHLKDVQRFFTHYHADHHKVYNLCSERTYPPKVFDNSVAHYPFADHNPPPFDMIRRFCDNAKAYLRDDPRNVIAVHCKAGKGRTGTMIVCLLMYMGTCDSAADALTFFARERTKNMKGVTIPSQKRYCYYFEHYLRCWADKPVLNAAPLVLTGFRLCGGAPNFDVGGGCDPYFKVFDGAGNKVYNSKKQGPKVVDWRSSQDSMTLTGFRVPVSGDVKVVFMDYDAMSADDKMCQFWMHTSFVPAAGGGGGALMFHKVQLDGAHKDKKSKHFMPGFTLEVMFEVDGDDSNRVEQPYRVQGANAYDAKVGKEEDDSDSEGEGLEDDELEDMVEYRWACEDNDVPPPPPPLEDDDDDDPPPPPPPPPAELAPPAPAPAPAAAAAAAPAPAAAVAPPSRKPPPRPVAAPVEVVPACGECGCDDYKANAFKKGKCVNCFHLH